MATIIFTNDQTKHVSAQEAIKLMLIRRGTLPATKKMTAYLKQVKSIEFDTPKKPALEGIRLPYKD